MIAVMDPTGDQEQEDKEETGERSDANDQREAPKTRYDDLNPQLLKCHICNKSMWDGRSFENHLSGRAHAIMMQKMSESYALTADTMRQEIKIREMKRTRKSGQQPPRDFYCAMCDMYAADGAIHRTTVGHRKLKKYLHPTCTQCHKEMPTRIELDEHRLTAEHLRNMQDKQEVVTKPKPEVMVISTMSMEQSYLREDRERWRRPDRYDRYKEQEVKEEKIDEQGDIDLKNAEENVEKDSEKTEQSEKVEEVEIKKEKSVDNDKTILDYKQGDDLSKITHDMIPVYSTERGVGRSFLSEFKCVQCSLCRKLLDSGETAEVHLKTWRHHQLFIRLLSKSSQQLQEGKRQMNVEESGNWKRRKTSRDDDTEDEHDIEHEEGDGIQEEVNGDKPANEDVSVETEKQEDSKIEEEEGIHAADEDLEDWEQSVDEILNDEKNTAEKATDDKKEDDEVILLDEDPEKTSQENVSTKPTPRRSRRRQ
ncbi:PREDICTED: zinc finger protein on ecdysone puffs isoform X2 [Papilio polytes]|uniref:zinc finger protein on ecdysone puffs isoform X2 n=1 Tax=Papilio polytes TaxID=76194 RepID=UPI000676557D|nr:PREDICTED: zinc finger protein on ecdysone puffs isoform X2 [Papilio polytes]